MKSRNINKGDKFNLLTVVKEAKRLHKTKRRFLCECDCGNKKEIDLIHLTSGRTRSCGCLWIKHVQNQSKGKDSPSWKGGKRIESGGYVEIYKPGYLKARKNGYVKEHRYVMEIKLGRYLHTHENVHHINGNKLDNRIENLELWSVSQPAGQRVSDKLKWAEQIIEEYRNEKH